MGVEGEDLWSEDVTKQARGSVPIPHPDKPLTGSHHPAVDMQTELCTGGGGRAGGFDPIESSDTQDAESARTDRAAATAAEVQAKLDLRVARAMFWGGFAALPFLWFVAYVHFRKAAVLPQAEPRLAVYVRRCRAGAVVGGLAFVAWLTTVSLSWRSWGQFGRDLMLVMPDDEEL